MKTLFLLLLALSTSHCIALTPLPPPPPPQAVPVTRDVTFTGVLECRIAIGGETTGWVLRCEREQKIEVLLPKEVLRRVREGARMTVTGIFETRKHPERGEVQVLVVRKIRDAGKGIAWQFWLVASTSAAKSPARHHAETHASHGRQGMAYPLPTLRAERCLE